MPWEVAQKMIPAELVLYTRGVRRRNDALTVALGRAASMIATAFGGIPDGRKPDEWFDQQIAMVSPAYARELRRRRREALSIKTPDAVKKRARR